MNPDTRKLVSNFAQPVLSGVIAAVATSFIFESRNIDFFGVSINPAIAIGSSSLVASLSAETIKNYVVPANNESQTVAMLAKPLIVGGVSAGVIALGSGITDLTGAAEFVALGAVSEISSSYLFNTAVKPYLV